ncbi:MAG TPA: aminotransferase class I/II-fold pyridoxal phosphate-dependent enzyme [Solirubrobacteraceae bacterium]|nr:aminotransferase class I/II-fold pyridoxal phosphate-dependent enzyme [Solirubrobacteraceae bacterium]
MVEIEARLDELRTMGLRRRIRLVSGPQGPHVLLDGKPVLLLCSDNFLGLADHAKVRKAAADAAVRWGAGAGASRLASGTMTVHRRLEERLAEFAGLASALLFGSGYLANIGAIAALARPGDVVFCDEYAHASIVDGCRLSGADAFVYGHCDIEHLRWGIGDAGGRGALIATEGVFSATGGVAPLDELAELAERRGLRLLVDDANGLGTFGPGGRGACAEAGIEADVITGSLGHAFGSCGGFVACDRQMASYLVNSAHTLECSGALPPPAVAAARAALDELARRPDRIARLGANAAALRGELRGLGFDVGDSRTQIIVLRLGDVALAAEIRDRALEQGIFVQAAGADLRLTALASHREEELRAAARTLAHLSRAAGFEPRARGLTVLDPAPGLFDHEAPARRAA